MSVEKEMRFAAYSTGISSGFLIGTGGRYTEALRVATQYNMERSPTSHEVCGRDRTEDFLRSHFPTRSSLCHLCAR